MRVEITLCDEASKYIVRNFFTPFFLDLSQYDPNMVINGHGLPVYVPDGEAEPDPSPSIHGECAAYNWWVRDACNLYVIRADGRPAGFITVAAGLRHLPAGVQFEVIDFYVAPKYRRQGVGRSAARQVFDRYRGRWQVLELDCNEPAKRFWREVIDEYTGGRFQNLNNGAEQRFDNGVPADR
jgi:predicted acetyltransferase